MLRQYPKDPLRGNDNEKKKLGFINHAQNTLTHPDLHLNQTSIWAKGAMGVHKIWPQNPPKKKSSSL